MSIKSVYINQKILNPVPIFFKDKSAYRAPMGCLACDCVFRGGTIKNKRHTLETIAKLPEMSLRGAARRSNLTIHWEFGDCHAPAVARNDENWSFATVSNHSIIQNMGKVFLRIFLVSILLFAGVGYGGKIARAASSSTGEHRSRAVAKHKLTVPHSKISHTPMPHTSHRVPTTAVKSQPPMQPSSHTSTAFTLTSPAFQSGATIPAEYTCDGKDGSPALAWRGAPEGTKSFALIVDDPDAPGQTWVHWTIWNIAPTTTSISARTVPEEATEGITSFGKQGYGGPCPPSGTHRYFFKLYALDTMLNLPLTTTARGLEAAIKNHTLKKVELMAKYSAK